MLRERLTYANVVSTLCLFIVLGGAAYAATALPANSVGTRQLQDEAVTGKKISKRTLRELVKVAGRFVHAPIGRAGPAGARGEIGPAGKNALFGETIAAGSTVTGNWNIYDPSTEASIQQTEALPAPAPVALTDEKVNFQAVAVANDKDESCSGDAVTPTAPPGKVCIYPGYGLFSVGALRGEGLHIGSSYSKVGFTISDGATSSTGTAGGTWAYTAP